MNMPAMAALQGIMRCNNRFAFYIKQGATHVSPLSFANSLLSDYK